jgi:type IV pilus assembly protein PilV
MKQAHLTQQHGSALLEALIAILIFSMGILALMGLLASSIKSSSDAKYRADAAYLANQLIGQMWVDRANIPLSYAHQPAGAAPCAPTGAASTNTNVTAWLAQVGNLLPGATAAIQQIFVGGITSSLAYPVTVTICWKAPRDITPHNFVATAQINK